MPVVGVPFFVVSRADEAGYPVVEGGDVNAMLETVDETEQKALAEAVYRLQQLQK